MTKLQPLLNKGYVSFSIDKNILNDLNTLIEKGKVSSFVEESIIKSIREFKKKQFARVS